jgi:hypothetical protein
VDEESRKELWKLFEVDQQRITALEPPIVAIRGWAITLDSALAGFAVSRDDPAFLLVALVATTFFALLDMGFRSVQLRHADRVRRIETELVPDHRLWPTKASANDQTSRPQVRSVRAYWTTLVFHVPLMALLAFCAALVG